MTEAQTLERKIHEAEQRMAQNVNEWLYAPFIGPPEKPRPIPWRTRLRWRWYAAREWVAVHVLRVEVAGDDD